MPPTQPTVDELRQLYNSFRNPINGALQFVKAACRGNPTPQQVEALCEISKDGAKVAIASGTGTGKSRLAAWTILWAVSCFMDANAVVTAPKFDQIKDIIWKEIRLVANDMEPFFLEKLAIGADSVKFVERPDTQFAVARTAKKENPAALRGWHAKHLFFILEESDGIDNAIFQAGQGSFARSDVRVLMISNPTRPEGFFFDAFGKNRERWTALLHWSSIDSPMVPADYAKNIADEYGTDSDYYRSRVLGLFPRNKIDGIIDAETIEKALGRILHVTEYNFAPIILGLDTAWFGDDTSVLFMRQGLSSWMLGRWRKLDTVDLAGHVAKFFNMFGADALFVDAGGPAAGGVIDQLRRLGIPVTPVSFSAASGKAQYINKRAEMWHDLRDWLRSGGSVPNDQYLKDDLAGPLYFFNSNGKIQMESKADMKGRGLASPDAGDALALTFAYPVIKRAAGTESVKAYSYEPGKG